jgi:flagellin-specific chaperone FliS
MLSLDHEQGGEVSRNLADLYAYVQQQILLGHCNQCDENFAEVERLLSTLLDSWVQISQVEAPVHVPVQEPGTVAASYSF